MKTTDPRCAACGNRYSDFYGDSECTRVGKHKELAMSITGASVSAFLRRAGFNPVAPSDRNREGLRCRNIRNGNEVFVNADLDNEAASNRLLDDVVAALNEAGYIVRRDPRNPIAYVTKPVVAGPWTKSLAVTQARGR